MLYWNWKCSLFLPLPFLAGKIKAHFFPLLLCRGLVLFALVMWTGWKFLSAWILFLFPNWAKQGKTNSYILVLLKSVDFINCWCFLSITITSLEPGCHVSQLVATLNWCHLRQQGRICVQSRFCGGCHSYRQFISWRWSCCLSGSPVAWLIHSWWESCKSFWPGRCGRPSVGASARRTAVAWLWTRLGGLLACQSWALQTGGAVQACGAGVPPGLFAERSWSR